jgi:hypothetical protein
VIAEEYNEVAATSSSSAVLPKRQANKPSGQISFRALINSYEKQISSPLVVGKLHPSYVTFP